MNNLQIISNEMEIRGINEEVDTFAGWNARGYKIRKGETSAFKTRIWKPVKSKEDDIEKMILVNANFFTESQVIEKK